MSAQSEQMKNMVNELIALIGGRGKGTERGTTSAGKTSKTGIHMAAAGSAQMARGKNLVVHKAREVGPERIIPMDDDFKDF
jgi:hypothetical protein